IALCRGTVWMIRTEQPCRGSNVLAQQRLCAFEIAAEHQRPAKVALAGRGLAVLLAEDLAANRKRFSEEGLRLACTPAIAERPAQLDEGDGDILVLRAQHAAPHG